MRLRTVLCAPLLLALALGVTACSGGTSAPSSGAQDRLVVATTVSPITSIAAAVAGDLAEIEGIVPEGTNSHTFEPEPGAAVLLSRADIVLINGLKLEDPTAELARANIKDGATVIELGTIALPESEWIYDFSFPKEEGKPNPHLWTDPTYAVIYAELMRDAFSAADPANASAYAKNADVFISQANALADALRKDQATVPNGNLKLVTYHDAYAYFAKNFGWTVVGAIQPKSFSDPTPQEVANLIKQVQAAGVTVIFGSEVFPSKVLEEIGAAAGVRYEDSLRDDDLPGAPGAAEHSWLGLMRYNYATMIRGLGGTTTNLDATNVIPAVPDTATYPQ
jgi:ABC-type Zn uptake system ZnuABC Zn-binding protein ZnuA